MRPWERLIGLWDGEIPAASVDVVDHEERVLVVGERVIVLKGRSVRVPREESEEDFLIDEEV